MVGPDPDVEGAGGFRAGAGSGGAGGRRFTLGVNGLLGVEADGEPSSVVQPPLLKPDTDVTGGGGIDATRGGSGGGGGGGEGGFGSLVTVVHPDCLKPPPEDEPPTVDQPPPPNPDFFSDEAGSVLGVGVAPSRLTVLTIGVMVLSFTPAALAYFFSSFSSLFLSFSLLFSIASCELAFARSFNCISLNLIL